MFVSEKLAALEVVRYRLNQAGLGHFCLELHSHKTQKKKFLEDIQARIDEHFPAPNHFQAKLVTLQRQKEELARYAELMGSRVGNALGLTVNEVFWAAERRRQGLGDLVTEVNSIGFPDASGWTRDDIESRRSRLSSLAELYDATGCFGPTHPWWGFRPVPLAPSDDEAIAKAIRQALDYAISADAAAEEAIEFFGFSEQPHAGAAAKVSAALKKIPPVPENASPVLLARMFDLDDKNGLRSSKILADVIAGVTETRKLLEHAGRAFIDEKRLAKEKVNDLRELTKRQQLSNDLLSIDIVDALEAVTRLDSAINGFDSAVRTSAAPYGLAGKNAVDTFLENCEKTTALGLLSFPICSITERAAAVLKTANTFSAAISKVSSIAERYGLAFNSTPDFLVEFADLDRLPGLIKGNLVDATSLAEARRYVSFPLADKSMAEIERVKFLLEAEMIAISEALTHCRQASERLGVVFDSTEGAVAETAAIAKIAAAAPGDLLEYRQATYGHARTAELIHKTRFALLEERKGINKFDILFYLDVLPTVSEIKLAIAALRRKEGFLAFFDGEWRKAKRLHLSLTKNKSKISGRQRAEELAALLSWIEAKDAFVSDTELKECFGGLFRGLETDPSKIARLNDWYVAGHAILVECPGLTEKIDLTTMPSDRISELRAKSDAVLAEVGRLAEAEEAIRSILGADLAGFREAKSKGWDDAYGNLGRAVGSLSKVVEFFSNRVDPTLSPKDALRMMEAKVELAGASCELSLLLGGEQAIRDAGGKELGNLADLAGGCWLGVVDSISIQASEVAEIAAQALLFAGRDLPLLNAVVFARAKSELDLYWSSVAPLPAWNRLTDWFAWLNLARDDASAVRSVLEQFAPYAKSEVSASEVFLATDEEAEARSILERLAGSDEVNRIFGEVFNGVETDLELMSQTHGWGTSVCSFDLPAVIRVKLLSENARQAFNTARHIYGAMESGCSGAREHLRAYRLTARSHGKNGGDNHS